MVLEEECGGVCEPSQGEAPCRQEERKRPSPQGVLLSLGPVMMVGGGRTLDVVGGFLTFLTLQGPGLWMGVLMAVTGATLTIAGLCILMTTLQVSDVPGHFLLHPRTGTRYSPHQALAIQRRLDRIRREMSEDSVRVPPSPPLPLPPTPPPWDLEAPPSYDSVMKSRGPSDL
ncbi:uncharacterized protein isoform X1 [Salmo salar]|uniref:Uncharacterized protein isoform X1 n=1 Tax=Salmo salar TaxID=8030 RepID=A0A1S3KIE9_SALSA|nr:uncharacterized protein LOC106560233 isoform X1 [Salmo salar]|eukprot:XP_013978352.1 PREDICTED: uncharacterized protein LOC106560233 isoform X1 [Salmo salar]